MNTRDYDYFAFFALPPFDQVCEAALAEDPMLLARALELACIDIWNETELGTPVTALAKRGKVNAVNFLLQEENGASPGFAARGFGMIGDLNHFSDLLKKDIVTKNPGKLRLVIQEGAYGFALHQDPIRLAAFLKQIQKDYPDEIPYLQPYLAKGHVQRGNIKAATAVFTIVKIKYPDKVHETATNIAHTLALSGNIDEIKRFFSNPESFGQVIVLGLIRGKHDKKLREAHFGWYEKNQADFNQFYLEGLILRGEVITGGYTRQDIAFYTSMAGQKPLQDDPHTRLTTLTGFIAGGHMDAAYDYFKKMWQKNRNTNYWVCTIAQGLALGKNVQNADLILEKMKQDRNIAPENIIYMENQLAVHFYQKGNEKAGWYFFKKNSDPFYLKTMTDFESSEDVDKLRSVLANVQKHCPELIEPVLKKFLAIKIKTLTSQRQFYQSAGIQEFKDRMDDYSIVLKSLVTVKAISPEQLPNYFKQLESTDYDTAQLTRDIEETEQLAVLVGFTRLSELLAWRDPVIQYLLLSNHLMPNHLIGIVVEYFSPFPDAQSLTICVAANKAAFFRLAAAPVEPEENKVAEVNVHLTKPEAARNTPKPGGTK